MQIDLLYEFDCARPWDGEHPWGQRAREQRAYREGIEQIRLADSLGYGTAWLVEHHFRTGRSHLPCSEAVLGALSQITSNIRLGFGVTLAPFNFIHPARIAEKVATVDILSGGRVEWGVGRSTPLEQRAFHVDPKTVLAESFEAMQIVSGMWREEIFEWDSPTFRFPKRMVTPKPFQNPHPPPWMATASKATAEMLGRRGLGLLSFAIMQPIEQLQEMWDAYRAAASGPLEPVTDRINHRVAVYTIVHCAETEAQVEKNGAWENVGWWYRNLAEFTLKWEMEGATREEAIKAFPLIEYLLRDVPIEKFKESDTILVGDPEACFEKMKRFVDAGVDNLLCYMQVGNLPNDAIKRSLELISTEVMPALEQYRQAKARETALAGSGAPGQAP